MSGVPWDSRASDDVYVELARLRRLVDSSPDAVLLVGSDGIVRDVNPQVERLFGYTAEEVVGHPVELLLPEALAEAHRKHRADYVRNPHSRGMGIGLDLVARRKDGTEVPIDVSLVALDRDDGAVVAAFVRDITERKRMDEYALRLHDAEVRRRHAFEINDSVVQGLAAALYAIESDHCEAVGGVVHRTLASARLMMDDLLDGVGGDEPIVAGDLVRTVPVTAPEPLPVPRQVDDSLIRVLLADDAEDLRYLLRLAVSQHPGMAVVAEAADGAEAVAAAERHQPDVVVLDLAMPVMDGLEAIPEIRARVPHARIVVLSGFDARRMRDTVLAAGADVYLEKGEALGDLLALVASLAPDKPAAATMSLDETVGRPVDTPDDPSPGADPALLTHELRTPLTVIEGVVATLLRNIDALPSPTVRELLEAVARNGRHMEAIIDAVADARHITAGTFDVVPEPVDVGRAVRAVINDLQPVIDGRPVGIVASDGIIAEIDVLRLRQAITNLVSNAAKFSPAGSPITITVDAGLAGVVIRVADKGRGVAPEDRERLFRRYAHFGTPGHGMGLGLYLSRGIARAHGGDLELESTDGPGSVFALTFPYEATATSVGVTRDIAV